jgi:hypothetical protein
LPAILFNDKPNRLATYEHNKMGAT